MKCSLIVRLSHRRLSCGQTPTKEFISFRSVTMEWPQTRASPDVGEINPHNMLNVVLLPAPLGPKRPRHSPYPTEKQILSTATCSFHVSKCILNNYSNDNSKYNSSLSSQYHLVRVSILPRVDCSES